MITDEGSGLLGLVGGLLITVLIVTFFLSLVSVGLVLVPKGAGGTVETYLMMALLEPSPLGVVWKGGPLVDFSGPRFLKLLVSSSSFN